VAQIARVSIKNASRFGDNKAELNCVEEDGETRKNSVCKGD